MRLLTALSMQLGLAGLFALSTACVVAPEKSDPAGDDDDDTTAGDDDDDDDDTTPAGDDDDDDDDTTTPPGDDDDTTTPPGDDDDDTTVPIDTDTDTDTTTFPPTDTYVFPTADTALGLAMYAGNAVLSPSYAGSESILVVGVTTGATVCEWTWSSTGVPSQAAVPCADPDGNACDFAFDVTLANDGAETGGDCYNAFGYTLGSTGGGPFGYGHMSDFQYLGTSYGPAMMYYYGSLWYGVSTYSTYTAGTWEYIWPVGYIVYVP